MRLLYFLSVSGCISLLYYRHCFTCPPDSLLSEYIYFAIASLQRRVSFSCLVPSLFGLLFFFFSLSLSLYLFQFVVIISGPCPHCIKCGRGEVGREVKRPVGGGGGGNEYR